MPPSNKDSLRTYLKLVPLPISSQKGIKIQARSDHVYNPEMPTRDSVRHENYHRRQKQWADQGFRSVNYKPYQGLGDPLHLDEKELALRTLGQWDEDSDSDSHGGDSDGDEKMLGDQDNTRGATASSNFILHRTRKDLNTLNKGLTQRRELMKNVRLGHSLFQLLQNEQRSKTEAERREDQLRKHRLRTEPQPPKSESSSDDDTDDELGEEVDLKHYLVSEVTLGAEGENEEVPLEPHPSRTDSRGKVAFLGTGTPDTLAHSEAVTPSRIKSGRSRSRSSRKNQTPSRPYTPQHSNIAVPPSGSDIHDKKALFRQLCVLYWLLESMNAETPQPVGPVTNCWNYKEVGHAGGQRLEMRARMGREQKERIEQKWKQFESSDSLKPYMAKKSSRTSLSMTKGPRRFSGHPRGSITSLSPSPSTTTGQSSSAVPGTPVIPIKVDSTIHEDPGEVSTSTPVDSSTVTVAPEEEEDIFRQGLFPFLEEYYASLSQEDMGDNDGTEDKNSAHDVSSARSDGSVSPHASTKKKKVPTATLR